MDDKLRETLRKEAAIRGKYANNNYLSATGFSMNIGISLSVSMQIIFKDTNTESGAGN
jgi:hypothetical protein